MHGDAFPNTLHNPKVHINDIKHLIQTVASGKTPSLATSWWYVFYEECNGGLYLI